MHSPRRTVLAFLLLGLLDPSTTTYAYKTSLRRQVVDVPSSLRPRLYSRDDPSGNSTIINVGNAQYVAEMTIGGVVFNTILDTGSSDLWISPIKQTPNSTDTGRNASIGYAVGNAAGNIHTAQIEFADFIIPSQSFIQVADTSSFGTLASQNITGLAGLGPGFSSVIRNTIGAGVGDTLLDNIFQLNKTTQNFITFLLSRNGDIGQKVDGQFTISEIVEGYSNITNQPKLPVNELANETRINQHWTTYMDALIGPDGKKIKISSIVDDTPSGKAVAVLDSGFTLPQVPRKVSDAIYGRVRGAEYDTTNQVWLIPCNQELNISVVMGGLTYPVHPLDTSSSDFGLKFSNGNTACAGTFQPISTAFSLGGQFDVILGEGFLRNTYTLLDWGDFVDETSASNARSSPYIQLQSVTNMADAHHDFVQARLNGVDTTSDPSFALLSKGQESPRAKGELIQHVEGFAYRNRASIAVGTLIGAAVLMGLIIWGCIRRRRRNAAQNKGMMPLGSGPSYYDVNASAPSLPMTNMGSSNHAHNASTYGNEYAKYSDPYYAGR